MESGTFAVLGRDRAKMSLSEEHKKVPHVATPQELREKGQWSFKRIPKWDDVPTGKLTLHPGGVVDLSSEAAFRQLIGKSVAELQAALAEARARGRRRSSGSTRSTGGRRRSGRRSRGARRCTRRRSFCTSTSC